MPSFGYQDYLRERLGTAEMEGHGRRVKKERIKKNKLPQLYLRELVMNSFLISTAVIGDE